MDTTSPESKKMSLSAASAAMVSGGIGALTIGILTTGAAAFSALKDFLAWYTPTGSLSGKTSIGIAAWLISWLILGNLWKDKEYDLGKAFNLTMILIAIGVILTFPLVFEAFGE
jgi:hypothetical protein